MNLDLKFTKLKEKLSNTKSFLFDFDLSNLTKLYKKILKRLPDISHLKNIVLFSGLATLIIFIMFAQRFSVLYDYLPTKPIMGGTFVEGMVGNIKQLNPLYSPINFAEESATTLIFSGLTKNIQNREVVGDLAKDWSISEDKKTYTFNLRDNLFWHDGERLNADDIYFTYKTIQNPDSNSPRLATWKDVEVKILDEKTISFTLPNPLASFIYLTDVPIIPEHILSGIPVSNLGSAEFSLNPIGSGPYVFSELRTIKDTQEVHLEVNENYYDGRPYINKIVLKSFPNYSGLTNAYNRKDVMSLARLKPYDIDRTGHLPNLKIKNLAIPEYDALFYNLTADLIKDKALREAISLAIDKNRIVSDIYYGEAVPIHSAILPGYLGYNNELRQVHDLDLAKEKLNSSGYKLSENGRLLKDDKEVTLRLVSTDEELKRKEAEIISEMIAELGIEVSLESYPLKTYIEEMVRPRNYDLILVTQNLGYDSDVYTFYHANMASDPGLNLSGIKNRQIDKYLEDARKSHDVKYRESRYKETSELINKEFAATYIVWPGYLYGISGDVKGLSPFKIVNPKDRFWDIKNWYILTKRDY